MKYYTIKPTEKLADYVRYFWVFEGTASESKPYIHRTFANVCPELLFHYKGSFNELTLDNKLQSSFVTGLHCHTNLYRRFVVNEQFGIFGVYLYPHALSALFDTPAIALTNELTDLSYVLKNNDTGIEERMLSASDSNEQVSIITTFLENRMKELKRPEIAHTVKSIMKAKGQVCISELSRECFLSARQFERHFKEHTGFAPKTFARIARFYSVVEQGMSGKKTLTEIAHIAGYYDQSHFISDFKEFSGFSPKTWFGSKPLDLCMD